MNLIEFKQGRSRGFDESVYVNPEDVSAIVPLRDAYETSGNNRTIIHMKGGAVVAVTDYTHVVAKKFSSP